MSSNRGGVAFGLTAFGMWGLLPLYWALLDTTAPAEVMAHRMVWSLPTALLILLVVGKWAWVRPLLRQPRRLGLVLISAFLISINWYLFIWSVANDRVLEASLGYFINPLLSIAIGVLLLRERLRPAQWTAVGIGGSAVVVMGVAYGQVPWLSLTLSVSFALYGLVKKHTALDGLEGFSADAAVQFLPALGFLVFLTARGDSTFVAEGVGHTSLLVASGLATALPLIFFGAAAVRVPLSTIGLMQYIAPAMMFLLGLLAFGEEMPAERLAGFLLVWTALSILTWDALRAARRNRRAPVARHTPQSPEGAASGAPATPGALVTPSTPGTASPEPAVALVEAVGPAAGAAEQGTGTTPTVVAEPGAVTETPGVAEPAEAAEPAGVGEPAGAATDARGDGAPGGAPGESSHRGGGRG